MLEGQTGLPILLFGTDNGELLIDLGFKAGLSYSEPCSPLFSCYLFFSCRGGRVGGSLFCGRSFFFAGVAAVVVGGTHFFLFTELQPALMRSL
uniref:Uncharacterized protein n=2 Tax=Picea TaxID=3328 RepID=A0A101M3H3_PICGL|nr:hypothetical protein ABT39_MTgene232 [Picea glauca]QHR90108.1 hypothetical protein Q903MT_gene4131 [Picea sitchensis]